MPQIRDVIYRPDSQQAARYTTPPLVRHEISLLPNRTNGEFLPQYEGEFAYIESCDLPCEVSFVNQDTNQTLSMTGGGRLSGPFKGILLKHDLYAVSGNNIAPKLILVVSKNAQFENTLYAPTFQSALAFNSAVTLGVAGVVQLDCPVSDRQRYIEIEATATITYTAAPVGEVFASLFFRDVNGAVIAPPLITKNGVAYALSPTSQSTVEANRITRNAAAFIYTENANFKPIPIPRGAVSCRVTLTVGAADNIASVAGGQGTMKAFVS